MRLDHLHAHQHLVSRRTALKAGAAAAGAAALSGTALAGVAAADPPEGGPVDTGPFDDEMFDIAAAVAGGWAPSRYGPDDQMGTWQEVGERQTKYALRLLRDDAKTYSLGETMFNGFPAFPSTPPRLHEQQCYILGYDPPAGFGGIVASTTPLGDNMVSAHEERFKENATYQIATQVDGLNHVGVGTTFYNGFRGPEIAADHGTTALGNETMPPIATRGVILDIVGLKQDLGEMTDLFPAPNGEWVLRDDYRITIEDILLAMRRVRVHTFRRGDVILFRTGWTHLVRDDPERYLTQEPGPYLAECRYLASFLPALIGSDTWGLEVLTSDANEPNILFPCHQVLLAQHGIRIGEAMRTEDLVNDNVFEFLIMLNPQQSEGATAGNTPPVGIGAPTKVRPRRVQR